MARMLQVRNMAALQTVQLVHSAGEDANPIDGSVVVILESDGIRYGVATWDTTTPTVDKGERKLYAIDDATKALLGYIYLRKDGKITIANQTQNLLTALVALITGIQGATFGGYPCVDATGQIAAAKTQLQGLLE